MLRSAVLLCLLAAAVAEDAFFEAYARQKIMTNCFGEELYYRQLAILEGRKAQCLQEPVFIPGLQHNTNNFNVISPGLPHPHVGYSYPAPPTFPTHVLPTTGYQRPVHGKARTVRQANDQLLVDRDAVLALIGKAQASLSNYTCLIRKLNAVDDNLNIRLDNLQRDYYQTPIEPALRQDLLEGIDFCYQLSRCLPVEIKSPIPEQLQRLLFFGKCEQKQRTIRCFKHDIRRNLRRFDLNALPDATHEGRVEKLAAAILVPEIVENLSGF